MRQWAPPVGSNSHCHPGALLQEITRQESAGVGPDWTGIRWMEQTGMGPRLITPKDTRTNGGSRLSVSQSVWTMWTGRWACAGAARKPMPRTMATRVKTRSNFMRTSKDVAFTNHHWTTRGGESRVPAAQSLRVCFVNRHEKVGYASILDTGAGWPSLRLH